MHFQGNQVHIKKSYLLFFIFIILFVFATPVLADYLGPDRTVTTASESCKMILYECMYVAAKGDYRYHRVEDWSCSNESKPWEAYDNSTVACESWNVGRTYYDKDYSVVTTTITHPEATVTSDLQNCTLQNGWCVTTPQLEITATEPLTSYQILLIEGTRNTEQFACGDVTCTVPLLEGENNFSYWALSSWGDSSRKGTITAKVDTVAPNINLQINGVMGLNNWYTSDVILSAIGQDDTSGLLEALLSVDSGTYTATTTLSDGVYQIEIIAKDNALNTSTASATIQVDTTTPTLSLTISGTKGNNNFYTSNTKITANTSDATSGVALVQAKIDNGNWIDASEINLSDGIHTYQFRVYDKAGNFTETPIQQIKIDTIAPTVEADTEINLGNTLFYTLQDNGSGLWQERIVIEDEDEKYKKIVWLQNISGNKIEGDILWDGKFADKTQAPIGEYYITFKIPDLAGNETFFTTVVKVNPLSYFQTIPEFTVPENTETSNEITNSDEEVTDQSFGGETSQTGNVFTTQTLQFTSSATAGMNANATSTSDLFTGAAALIATMTGVALYLQTQRKDEEAEQIAQVTAEVDAKNAAIEANRIEMIEQLKIRNWLIAQQNLEEQERLNQLADEEIEEQWNQDRREHSLNTMSEMIYNNTIQQAYDTYRQGEYVSVPMNAGASTFSNLWNSHVTPLVNNLSNQWNEFTNNITTPSSVSGPLFNLPFANSPVVNNIVSFGSIIDFTLFNGQLTQTYLQTTQSANNLISSWQTSPTYNAIDNAVSFGAGAVLQYLNDNSFGLVDHFVNFENGSDAFQSGMEFGRTVSTIQGAVEIVVGLGTAAYFLGSIPPTGAFTLGCAGATGGICLIPGALAISAEVVMAGAGAALAWHGSGLLNNANNPLQIRGNGGGSNLPPNPELGYFGTNKQNTSANAQKLFENMGVKRPAGYAAHHIIPSGSTRPDAIEARRILESFGIDINNAGNGIMIPNGVNSHLNNPTYERAVLEALQDAQRRNATSDEVINILQEIGVHILEYGTYP